MQQHKTIEDVEIEVRDYVTKKLRKNRGNVVSIDVKLNSEYFPNAVFPNFIIGAFVNFDSGDRIFVYRFENKVNNFANNRGYGTYSKSYNTESKVREVVVGWNTIGSTPLGSR